MDNNRPPVCFKDYTREKITKGSNKPPQSIRADDLDKNFTWAGIVVEDKKAEGFSKPVLTIEEQTVGGHKQRKLVLGGATGLPLYTALNGQIYEVEFVTLKDPQLVS